VGEWPDHYPESCPPGDATTPAGACYRLVKKAQPEERDFMSHLEMHLKGVRFTEKNWADSKDCLAAGLSVYPTKDAAEQKRKSNGGMKRLKIAEGDITGVGLLGDTSSKSDPHHQTWWVEENFDPVPIFQVIE
jgi:hypothetical protein